MAFKLITESGKDEIFHFVNVALGKALLYNDLEKYEKVFELVEIASQQIREVIVEERNIEVFCSMLSDIAFLYGELELYVKSLDFNFVLLEYEKQLYDENKYLNISTTFHNIGYDFEMLGNYSNAIDYYYMALDYRETIMNSTTANTYELIAETYEKMGDTTKTLDFLFKALSIYENDPTTSNIPFEVPYEWISKCYYKVWNLNKAYEYYIKFIKILEKTNNKELLD